MRKKDDYIKIIIIIIVILILYYLITTYLIPKLSFFTNPPQEATPTKVARKLFRGK